MVRGSLVLYVCTVSLSDKQMKVLYLIVSCVKICLITRLLWSLEVKKNIHLGNLLVLLVLFPSFPNQYCFVKQLIRSLPPLSLTHKWGNVQGVLSIGIPKNFKENGCAPKELWRRHPQATVLSHCFTEVVGENSLSLRVTFKGPFPYPLKPEKIDIIFTVMSLNWLTFQQTENWRVEFSSRSGFEQVFDFTDLSSA